MTGATVTDRPAPRRRVRLRAVVALGAAVAIMLAWAPAAHAGEVEPLSRDPIDVLLPGEPPGPYPTGRYIVGYKLDHVLDARGEIFGMLTELLFSIGRTATRLGLWTIEQTYSFGVVGVLVGPAVALANAMQRSFVGVLRLNDFALFLAVFYSGYQLLRHRTVLGLSELVVSLLVAVLGAAMLANPGPLLENGLAYATQLSAHVLELAVGTTDTDAGLATRLRAYREATSGRGVYEFEAGEIAQLVAPLTGDIHDALVEQPYDLVAFGALLDGTPCARARDEILGTPAISPGTDEARAIMRGASGCAPHADFNERASPDRAAVAGLSMLVSMVVMAMLAAVAITVLIAQFLAAGQLVVMPFAILAGTVPGGGRRVLVRWASGALQTLGVIVAMSFLLALLIVITATLLGLEDVALVTRFVLLLVSVAAIFRARRRIVAAAENVSNRVLERLHTPQLDAMRVNNEIWKPRAWVQPQGGAGIATTIGAAPAQAWSAVRGLARGLPRQRRGAERPDSGPAMKPRPAPDGGPPAPVPVRDAGGRPGPVPRSDQRDAPGPQPGHGDAPESGQRGAGAPERDLAAGDQERGVRLDLRAGRFHLDLHAGRRAERPTPAAPTGAAPTGATPTGAAPTEAAPPARPPPHEGARPARDQAPPTPPGRLRQSLEAKLRTTAHEVGMLRSAPRRAREAAHEVGTAARDLPANTRANMARNRRELAEGMREEFQRASQAPSHVAEWLRSTGAVRGQRPAGPKRKGERVAGPTRRGAG